MIGIIVGLVAGLGIFLLGIQMMAEGLHKAAGERMRRILELFTSKRITAVATGAVVTAFLQSSSTTTVMIVGFVNSGLMTLSQAVGTIMGANIGTTITAQLVSFNIYALAYPLVGIGAMLYHFGKRKSNDVGLALLGFGFLLMGLSTMSTSVKPISDYQPFVNLVVSFGKYPILGIIAGTIFTVLIQSSSATTGLVIALSWQGIIDLHTGLALIVGANLGTCITVVLASLRVSITAKKAALGHILFNTFAVLLFILFRKPFTAVVLATGNTASRQIANAHTLFNVITTLILFPLLPYFVKLIERLVPGEDLVIDLKPKFLDNSLINTPAAIFSAQQEAIRMGEQSIIMLEQAVASFITGKTISFEEIKQREELVNSLEKAITSYLAKTNQHPLDEKSARMVTNMMHIVNDIERIADHATNLTELAELRVQGDLSLSKAAVDDLQNMYDEVARLCTKAIEALASYDAEKAKSIIGEDDLVDDLEKLYRTNHIERLSQGQCEAEIGVLFLDAVSNLERIADHATNIAEAVADIAFAK